MPTSSIEPRLPEFSIHRSFSAGDIGGNLAGVVLSGTPLRPKVASRVARDLCLPTTGFAVPETSERILTRLFTPDQEVAACGHVSVAIASELFRRSEGARGRFSILAPGGETFVQVEGSTERPTVKMTIAVRNRIAKDSTRAEVSEISNISLAAETPMTVVETGLVHLLVHVKDRGSLSATRMDRLAWQAFGEKHGIDTIGLFALGENEVVHLRDICAPIGDTEEAASGTTCSALAFHLKEIGVGEQLQIVQGEDMGRPSHLATRVTDHQVTVSGIVSRVAHGWLD